MKTQNTIKQLCELRTSALQHATAMEAISNQFSHPTIEKMRADAAQDARHYANDLRAIINTLNDGQTDDAAEETRMMLRMADKAERQAWTRRDDWSMELTKEPLLRADAWRVAADLLARENGITLEQPKNYATTPLQEGGEK